jgi:hypothetical protein
MCTLIYNFRSNYELKQATGPNPQADHGDYSVIAISDSSSYHIFFRGVKLSSSVAPHWDSGTTFRQTMTVCCSFIIFREHKRKSCFSEGL